MLFFIENIKGGVFTLWLYYKRMASRVHEATVYDRPKLTFTRVLIYESFQDLRCLYLIIRWNCIRGELTPRKPPLFIR